MLRCLGRVRPFASTRASVQSSHRPFHVWGEVDLSSSTQPHCRRFLFGTALISSYEAPHYGAQNPTHARPRSGAACRREHGRFEAPSGSHGPGPNLPNPRVDPLLVWALEVSESDTKVPLVPGS